MKGPYIVLLKGPDRARTSPIVHWLEEYRGVDGEPTYELGQAKFYYTRFFASAGMNDFREKHYPERDPKDFEIVPLRSKLRF